MCNVGLTHTMQWKPSLPPNFIKKMSSSSKSCFGLRMAHELSAQQLQTCCIRGLKHQFSKERGVSSQPFRTVWSTQICSNSTFAPSLSHLPPVIWKGFIRAPNLTLKAPVSKSSWKNSSWRQCFTDKQQAFTGLTTVLNSNLKKEMMLKIQPREVNLLKNFSFWTE